MRARVWERQADWQWGHTQDRRGLYGYARIRVYAYTCLFARVNAVSGLFFREGGLPPPSQILCLRIYNVPTVCTISKPRLLVVHSVYGPYPGKRVCAQWPQTIHSVYKLYTLSNNYTQCPQTIHSVYKLYTVSTNYA